MHQPRQHGLVLPVVTAFEPVSQGRVTFAIETSY